VTGAGAVKKLPTEAEILAAYDPVMQFLDLGCKLLETCDRCLLQLGNGEYPKAEEISELQTKAEELESKAIHLEDPFQKLDDLKDLVTVSNDTEGVLTRDIWAVELVLMAGKDVARFATEFNHYLIANTTKLSFHGQKLTIFDHIRPKTYYSIDILEKFRDALRLEKAGLLQYLIKNGPIPNNSVDQLLTQALSLQEIIIQQLNKPAFIQSTENKNESISDQNTGEVVVAPRTKGETRKTKDKGPDIIKKALLEHHNFGHGDEQFNFDPICPKDLVKMIEKQNNNELKHGCGRSSVYGYIKTNFVSVKAYKLSCKDSSIKADLNVLYLGRSIKADREKWNAMEKEKEQDKL